MGSEQLETIFVDESGDHHQMIEVHELGFVKLIDTMGDDEEVENYLHFALDPWTPEPEPEALYPEPQPEPEPEPEPEA